MSLFQSQVERQFLAGITTNLTPVYDKYLAYFGNSAIQANILEVIEEQYQGEFIRALFVDILGYTAQPHPNFNLIREKKNETDAKSADAAISINNQITAVIELKDHKTQDLKKVVVQAFGYKNNHKNCHYVVTSNFERLRFYIDNAVDFIEFDLFKLTFDEFRRLWLCLSYESIAKNLPQEIKNQSLSNEDVITKQLYKDYSVFKRNLFDSIVLLNPDYDKLLLFKKTQKLLDRFLFLLFAEDKELLPANSVKGTVEKWKKFNADPMNDYQSLYSRFVKYFKLLDVGYKDSSTEIYAYNGGLFANDDLLNQIRVEDAVLSENVLKLATYDYDTDVDVNILGHIFENSLNEIEQVANEITTGVKTTSKRKQDGVFYTPRYITQYIVENTVGRLCEEKKTELGIGEELFEYKRAEKRKQALKVFDSYREWLLHITIVDPACGSGAFLNMALDFLIAEHNWIDLQQEKIAGLKGHYSMELSNIENTILENNLFGVDINDESVEIAKLSLWLRTAKPHRKLNSLNNNIKCGNSLIDDPAVAGEKAFDWHKEFPQIFAKGGFDVVIGNPPYVSAIDIKKYLPTVEYNFLKSKFITAKGTVDLYIYFFEKGLSILKKGAYLSYITPNRFLSASYGAALRELLIFNYKIENLTDYSDKIVFPDASTYPVISFIKNETVDNYTIKTGKFDEKTKQLIYKDVPSSKLKILDEYILGFLLNDKLEITEKIISICESLDRVGKINATSTAKEADDYSILINNENGLKLINTGTIDPYFTNWGVTYMTDKGEKYIKPYLSTTNDIISKNRVSLYSSPKIIISKIGLQCEAFYDQGGDYASINTNCIHSFQNDYLPEYLLCWLNSRLYNYLFECLFDGLRMSGGYLLYSAPNLKNTYILKASKQQQKPFISKANLMLTLNTDLQEISQKFQRMLQRKFELEELPGKLQNWYLLSYKEFIAELGKKKVKLTLAQEAEWEEFFTTEKAKALEIKKQIDDTDKEIDRMVYALYDLTEEEVGIVEGEK